jgi:hypothetical protein
MPSLLNLVLGFNVIRLTHQVRIPGRVQKKGITNLSVLQDVPALPEYIVDVAGSFSTSFEDFVGESTGLPMVENVAITEKLYKQSPMLETKNIFINSLEVLLSIYTHNKQKLSSDKDLPALLRFLSTVAHSEPILSLI